MSLTIKKKEETKWFPKVIGAYLMIGLFNPLFIVFWSLYSRLTTKKRFKKEIKIYFQIRNRSVLFFWIVGAILFGMMTGNFITNIIRSAVFYLFEPQSIVMSFLSSIFNLRHLFDFYLWGASPILVLVISAISSFAYCRFVNKLYRKQRDLNGDEQGDDRLITLRELKKTYKKIPNRGQRFKGYGGIPVGHLLAPVFQLKRGLKSGKFIDFSPLALKSKMICHFPRLDKENEGETNKDEFVDENSSLFIKGLAHFGKWLTDSERLLNMVTDPSGYYYILAEAINSVIIGMTRSGKGETVVNVLLDNLSRAQKQSSMVIGDPKGELYQMSYDTLIKRGYNVQVLNFQNVDFSMSYNPLQRAIDFAKKGYYENVQTEVDAVAEAFYRNAKALNADGNAKFWEDSSINLFSALTMAIIWRAQQAKEWETVTLRSMVTMLNQLGSEEVMVDSNGQEVSEPEPGQVLFKRSRITLYFDELRKINKKAPSQFLTMADDSFRQSNFAGEETKGSIFSSMISGVKNFLNDSIARMTSENQLDMTMIGFPRQLSIKIRKNSDLSEENPYLNEIATLSIFNQEGKRLIKKTKVIIDNAGYLNFMNVPLLPEHSVFKIEIKKFKEELRFNVEKKHDKIKKITIDEGVDRVVKGKGIKKVVQERLRTTKNITIEPSDIELKYSEKPTAIFLVMPPNRKSFNGMVSLFVDQMFNANYDLALNAFGRTCVTRINYILDEFGNLPKIPGMDTKLTIGLSSNQLFTLFLQNLEQVEAVYGKQDAESILDNCTISEYIKSVSSDTMKKFEDLSGDKTVTTQKKNISENQEVSYNHDTTKQAVLTKGQLQKLQSGEAMISVGVKAETKSGKKTTNYPILVAGKLEFPSRYMFLVNEFNQDKTLADIPVRSKHRHLKLSDIAMDWKENYQGLVECHNSLVGGTSIEANESVAALKKGRNQAA